MSAPALSPTSTSSTTGASATAAAPAAQAQGHVIANAEGRPAAQALASRSWTEHVHRNHHHPEQPGRRDEELLEVAVLPQVSVRSASPAGFMTLNADVTTADGMEFTTTSWSSQRVPPPPRSPGGGLRPRCSATPQSTTPPGWATPSRTSPGSWAGVRWASWSARRRRRPGRGRAARPRGVRPIRTTVGRPPSCPPSAGPVADAAGIVFEDGSSMNGGPRGPGRGTHCPATSWLPAPGATRCRRRHCHRPGLPHLRPGHLGHR